MRNLSLTLLISKTPKTRKIKSQRGGGTHPSITLKEARRFKTLA